MLSLERFSYHTSVMHHGMLVGQSPLPCISIFSFYIRASAYLLRCDPTANASRARDSRYHGPILTALDWVGLFPRQGRILAPFYLDKSWTLLSAGYNACSPSRRQETFELVVHERLQTVASMRSDVEHTYMLYRGHDLPLANATVDRYAAAPSSVGSLSGSSKWNGRAAAFQFHRFDLKLPTAPPVGLMLRSRCILNAVRNGALAVFRPAYCAPCSKHVHMYIIYRAASNLICGNEFRIHSDWGISNSLALWNCLLKPMTQISIILNIQMS